MDDASAQTLNWYAKPRNDRDNMIMSHARDILRNFLTSDELEQILLEEPSFSETLDLRKHVEIFEFMFYNVGKTRILCRVAVEMPILPVRATVFLDAGYPGREGDSWQYLFNEDGYPYQPE